MTGGKQKPWYKRNLLFDVIPGQLVFNKDQKPEKVEWLKSLSRILRNILLTMTGYSFFCLMIVGGPDKYLLCDQVKIPFAQTDLTPGAFYLFGPLVLVVLNIYAWILFCEWRKVEEVDSGELTPFMFNLKHNYWADKVSILRFYVLTPVVLLGFTWKALALGNCLTIYSAILFVFVCTLWFSKESSKSKVTVCLGGIIFVVMFLGCFGFSRSYNLEKEDLSGEYFQHADLRNANMKYADLRDAYCANAEMEEINLQFADLSRADLHNAQLPKARMMNAFLKGTILNNAVLNHANLTDADLELAKMRLAHLKGSILTGANLYDVDLYNAKMIGANLENANLTLATLIKADLSSAKMKSAKMESAKMEETILVAADLVEADLRGANLNNANLERADLEKADLRDTENLTCAQLKKAKNWKTTYRNPILACKEPIPIPP